MEKKINLAIFSPFESSTETFIKAHKKLPFRVSYFFNGLIPTSLEGIGSLVAGRYTQKVLHKVSRSRFSFEEQVLLTALKRQNIQCILAEYGPTAAESLSVIRHLSIPLIVHFHGYDASRKDTIEKYGQKYKDLFEYANTIVAVSEAMIKDLIALGCPGEKILLNPYGPDESFLEIVPDYNSRVFLFVGRLVDKKAPYYTIAAFAQVNKVFPEAELWMIGDGPLLNTCMNLATYFGVANKVVFKGSLAADEIRNAMKDSFAYVQHSIRAENGDAEGAPVAIMEAQAAGLPVVSTIHAGIPDIVQSEETGLLVPEHDVKGMAEAMITLLKYPDKAEEMGIAGKERIKKYFSLSKHLQLLEEAVKNAVND